MRVSGFDGHRRKVLMTPLKVWRSSCDPVLGFHGPQALYASSYSEKQLQEFANKFKHWKDEGHSVWAFFNNDIHMHALHNAEKLKEMV